MIKGGILALFLMLSLISLTSASVVCNPNQVDITFIRGATSPSETINCNNDGNESVDLSTTGQYFSLQTAQIPASTAIDIVIDFDSSAPLGIHFGSILFSDNSPVVPIFIEVEEEPLGSGNIIIFPTTQRITVQQGKEKTQVILLSVPNNYPESISIQSISFNPLLDTIVAGDLNLGIINPGTTFRIPIIYSGVGAQTGQYVTTLDIFATNSSGRIPLPSVNLELQVTSGINPGGTSPLTRPSCSIDAVIMNLNETYTLTCSNVDVNIDVGTPYNEFFKGISSDRTAGIYTYRFTPIKFGITNFIASFFFGHSRMFNPFIQKVTISSTGAGLPGTDLKLTFTPPLSEAVNGEEIIIQIVDNKTNSLIIDSELYINSIRINPEINSNSFTFAFETGRTYQMRAVATGYSDLIQDIEISTNPVEININPSSGNEDTDFNITTDSNATLYIDGSQVDNPYFGKISSGIIEISAFADGFGTTYINLTVDEVLKVRQASQWEKNTIQTFTLNENATWEVLFQKNTDSDLEVLHSGDGSHIEFTPKKKGTYRIKSGGNDLFVGEIKGWDGEIFTFMWYWWVGIIGLVGVARVVVLKRSVDTSLEAKFNLGRKTEIGEPSETAT